MTRSPKAFVRRLPTNFGLPIDQHENELKQAREAIRVGLFLGAPLLRIFAGSPAK